MNLREENLPFTCEVSRRRFEALLNDETVESVFKKLGENNQVETRLKELANSIETLNRLMMECGYASFEEISSEDLFEDLIECAKLNTIAYIMCTKADPIFFDGKRVQDVIADPITLKVFIEELSDAKREVDNQIWMILLIKAIKEMNES